MALTSIGNYFYPTQSYSYNPLNTVSGLAKSIWKSSGWESNPTTTESAAVNKSLYTDLGNIRTAAASVQPAASSMASLTQYSSNTGKTAVYSEADVLSATVSKNASVSSYNKTNVNVAQLAEAQKNEGAALKADENSFGSSFSISITNGSGKTTSFNVNLTDKDNNKSALQAMAKEINNSDIGVKAALVEDKEKGTVRLELESNKTGETDGSFTVKDENAGLENVARNASNARYSVNGKDFSSQTNEVKLQDGITATLKKAGSTQISYKADIGSAVGKVKDFLDKFNKLSETAADSPALKAQLSSLTKNFGKALGYSGISINSEGKLTVSNEEKLKDSIVDGSFAKNFQGYNSFGSKLSDITRNAYKTAYTSAMQSNLTNIMSTANQTDWFKNAATYSGLLLNVLV